MAKKVAVLAVNPVNGCGLFQYLEAFFENGISYKVFAVSDTKEIKTNSGISLTADDVIANLKGHEDEFDALVFSCGDAVPVFQQNADKPYNVDLMQVIKTFGDKGKMMIGHCAGAMMFDFTGITKGKKVAVHPLAKPAIQNGTATDKKSEIDGNFFTAQDENTIWTMMPQVIEALKQCSQRRYKTININIIILIYASEDEKARSFKSNSVFLGVQRVVSFKGTPRWF